MLGLIYKDFIYIFKTWFKLKFLLSILIVIVLAFLIFKQSSSIIFILLTMLMINSIQILFIEDSNFSWLIYLDKTSDISKLKIVCSRFTISLIVCILSNSMLFFLNLLTYLTSNNIKFLDTILITFVSLFISIIYIAIFVPFVYAYSNNGLIFTVITFITISLLISKLPFINSTSIELMKDNIILSSILSIIFIIILFTTSIIISTLILKKQFK